MRKKFLLSSIALITILLFSCKKTEVNIYTGSSQLWVKVADNSVSSIKALEISFTSVDIKDNRKDYIVAYSNENFKPKLGTMDKIWTKVHESFSKADSIAVLFNGKTYKTRGYSFGEKRFIEIVLTYSSTGGDFNIIDHDITEVEKTIYIE